MADIKLECTFLYIHSFHWLQAISLFFVGARMAAQNKSTYPFGCFWGSFAREGFLIFNLLETGCPKGDAIDFGELEKDFLRSVETVEEHLQICKYLWALARLIDPRRFSFLSLQRVLSWTCFGNFWYICGG